MKKVFMVMCFAFAMIFASANVKAGGGRSVVRVRDAFGRVRLVEVNRGFSSRNVFVNRSRNRNVIIDRGFNRGFGCNRGFSNRSVILNGRNFGFGFRF